MKISGYAVKINQLTIYRVAVLTVCCATATVAKTGV